MDIDFSFVIPCFCCVDNIDYVVNNIYDTMNLHPEVEFEIILVNDFSGDETWNKICLLSSKYKKVKGINFARNFGQHNALMAGFRAAKGEYIITSDDDGQSPISIIWNFYDKIVSGYDVVCAKYIERERKGVGRSIGTIFNEMMLNIVLNKPKDLYLSSFFMARKFVIDEMCKYEYAYPYMAGLLLRTTGKIGNVETIQNGRVSGQSGYTVKKLLKLWINGFTTFSIKPLHLFVKVGGVVAIFGCLEAIYSIFNRIINGTSIINGYTSLIAVICIIGGANLAVLGAVGEYIGRIYMCINNQPQYVIKAIVQEGVESYDLSGSEKVF